MVYVAVDFEEWDDGGLFWGEVEVGGGKAEDIVRLTLEGWR